MKNLLIRVLRSYRSSAAIVSLRLGGAFAGILVNLALARSMDAEQLAVTWTTISMAIVATLVLTLGVDAASVRVIARRLAVDDLAETKGYVIFTLRLTRVLGVLWLVACWGAALFIVDGDDGFLQERLLFIGAVAPIVAQMRVMSMHSLADGRAVQANLPRLFLLPGLQLVGIFIASLVFQSISAVIFLGIYTVCIIAVTTLQWVFTRPLHDRLSATEPEFSMWGSWLVTGGLLALPALLTDFSRDIISALSIAVLSATDVAILAMALKLTAFLRFGIVAINQVFAAKLGAAIARDDKADIDRILAVSTLLKIGPVAVLVLVLLLFGTEIMAFFSPELAVGGPVLAVLTIETVLLVLFGPSAPFMSLGKGHSVLPIFGVTSVAIMCGLTLLLGPLYGAIGAAWAFSIAWGTWAVLGMLYVRSSQGRDISVISAVRWAAETLRQENS